MTNALATRSLYGHGYSTAPLQPRRDRVRALYRRAVFRLDARFNPAGGAPTDLSANALTVQNGSTSGSDNSDVLFLPAPSTYGVSRYVYLPGIAGNFLSAPDEAALDITGPLDVRVHVSADDWTPSSTRTLIAKRGASGQVSWQLRIETGGRPTLVLSNDGNVTAGFTATASPTVTDGANLWLRATTDNVNVRFYTSSDGTTWTQLGADVADTMGSIHAGTAELQIGASNSTDLWLGRFFRAQVYDGIDGVKVFDWSAEDTVTATHSAFTASTGQTVTVNRATSGRKTVVVEAAKWLLGTDDYLEVPDNALLDIDAATDFTVLAVLRQHATPANEGRWISKRDSGGTFLGWEIRADPTDGTKPQIIVDDGPDNAVLQQPATTTLSAQGLSLVGLVVDRTAATLTEVTRTGTLGTSGSTAAVGDCSNAFAMRIGSRANVVGSYQDFELYAVYIWREALTASELAAIAADWGAV